jgi:hypothetical protein
MNISNYIHLWSLVTHLVRAGILYNSVPLIGTLLSQLTFMLICSRSMEDKTDDVVTASPRRTCPTCKEGELRRSKRKGWMSMVPFSKYYSCSQCRSRFLRLFDTVQLRMADGTGGSICSMFSGSRKKKFVLVFSATTGLVYACFQIVFSLY